MNELKQNEMLQNEILQSRFFYNDASNSILNNGFELSHFKYDRNILLSDYALSEGLKGCKNEIYKIVASLCLNNFDRFNKFVCSLSLVYMSWRSSYSLASVKRSIKWLCDNGYIKKIGIGRNGRNKYRLLKCYDMDILGARVLYMANNEPLKNLKKEKRNIKENDFIITKDFVFRCPFRSLDMKIKSDINKGVPSKSILFDNIEELIKIVKANWLN